MTIPVESTPIRWLVNGVNLHATYGRQLPLAGAEGMFFRAPYLGSNVVIPGVAGELHVRKVRGAGRAVVPVLLRGATSSGAAPAAGASIKAFMANLMDLQDFLDTPATALTLRREIDLPAGGVLAQQGPAELDPASLIPGLTAPWIGTCVLIFSVLSGNLVTV